MDNIKTAAGNNDFCHSTATRVCIECRPRGWSKADNLMGYSFLFAARKGLWHRAWPISKKIPQAICIDRMDCYPFLITFRQPLFIDCKYTHQWCVWHLSPLWNFMNTKWVMLHWYWGGNIQMITRFKTKRKTYLTCIPLRNVCVSRVCMFINVNTAYSLMDYRWGGRKTP